MDITFEGNTLTASEDTRIISGVLVPYDEEGRTNLGKFSVPRGAFELPSDPSQMGVNVEHAREAAFGGGVSITDSPKGVVFAARAANTPEGDQALADVASGKRTHWSVEAAGIVVEKGKAIAGRIFGAALVEKPAFPGAVLLASLTEDEDGNAQAVTTDPDAETGTEPTETVETHTDEYVDEFGVTVTQKTTTTTVVDGDTTTITTVTEYVTPDPEAEPETPEEEPIVSTLTASARRGATRPHVRPSAVVVQDRPAAPDLSTLFAAMSDARVRVGDVAAQATLMAALTEIKTSGSLGPAGGGAPNQGLPDNWMGQLWNGRDYDRKFISLQTQGTDISARGKRGFRAKRGTKAAPLEQFDGEWAGDLAAVKSANAYIEESSSALHKWALAETIAREFTDLPGGAEFLEAFMKLIVEDYAVWSDYKALAVMMTTAGAPIAPRPVPERYAASPSLGMLIQGIRTINSRRDTATYAVVNSTAYDELIYTPKDLVPEYVSFEFTTESRGTADSGKVIVVEADDADFKNLAGVSLIKAGEPGVLVGSQRAIEFDELGSTPLAVDALEIAKGGIDRATHGYLQGFVARSESVAMIGAAPVGG